MSAVRTASRVAFANSPLAKESLLSPCADTRAGIVRSALAASAKDARSVLPPPVPTACIACSSWSMAAASRLTELAPETTLARASTAATAVDEAPSVRVDRPC